VKGLLIAVWPISDAMTDHCDKCPRVAKWFVAGGSGDEHLCLRHTVAAIKEAEQAVERG